MEKERIRGLFSSPAAGCLRRWSRACRWPLLAICLLRLLITGGALLIPLATRGLIDSASAGDGPMLARYAAELILTVVGMRLVSLAVSRLSVRTSAAVQKNLRATVLEVLLKKQYAGLAAFHSGELVSRVLSDVQVVRNGMLEILPGAASMAVSFFGAAVILGRMDWRLAAAVVACALLGLTLAAVLEMPMKRRHTAVREAESAYHASLQEGLEHLLLIKASGSESRVARRIGGAQERLAAAQIARGDFSNGMNQAIHLTFQLSWLMCLVWGGIGIYRGGVSYGMLAAMLQLVNLVQGPVSEIAGLAGQAYAALGSAERLQQLLELPEEPKGTDFEAGQLESLRLENVSFGYDRDTGPVLCQISCTIRSGEFVAITGLSGEGKSTLFRLLLGVYAPDSGRLEVDIRDAGQRRTVPVSAGTRSIFAYIPQGNSLFSGTLRENLTMFDESVSDRQIAAAARVACIEELISTLPDGLDTILGERGTGLSEGQAQRIAIARAILTKAPVLLLDESTSALDEQTEARLLGNLSRLPGRTCLIVTHRKAALEICDYCLHMAHGALTARLAENEKKT